MNQRKSGILVHPTSFPSKYGIGDLSGAAYDFIDFLKQSGTRVWQILPLGHTSFGDSPYQSFSAFAGNPLIISIDELIKDKLLTQEDIGENFNFDENKTDFGKVIDFKYPIFRKAFLNFKILCGKNKNVKKEFESFCSENSFWLDDYTLFIALKNYFIDKRKNTYESPEYKKYYKQNKDVMSRDFIADCFYGGAFNSWPEEIVLRKSYALSKWKKTLKNEILFYKFLQYKFFEQWAKLKKYANSNGIEIIGDIPIFVSGDSADVWSNPELFRINEKGYPTEVAGVPPDYFSETGQLWGNPLYDWDMHEKTKYKWWILRIKKTLEIVDVLRIDHFRAFESYWSIPYGEKTAVNGKWEKGPQTALFDALKNEMGDLPIIAEDLGDLNPEVIELRDKLGFPGMKILQFGFGDGSGNEYLPHNYKTTNCVVYTGTHDNDTTVGWYKSSDEKTKDFVRRFLRISGDDIAWDFIRLAFSSTAELAVIPIQDILNMDCENRMNTPGIAGGNWQFRYRNGMLTKEIAAGVRYLVEMYNRG